MTIRTSNELKLQYQSTMEKKTTTYMCSLWDLPNNYTNNHSQNDSETNC